MGKICFMKNGTKYTIDPCTEGITNTSPKLKVIVPDGTDEYGFTTNVSASVYSPRFRVMDKNVYLGRIESYTSSRVSTSETLYRTDNYTATKESAYQYQSTRASTSETLYRTDNYTATRESAYQYHSTRASTSATYYATENHWNTRQGNTTSSRQSDYVDYTYVDYNNVTGYGTRQDVNYYQTRESVYGTYYRQTIFGYCDYFDGVNGVNGSLTFRAHDQVVYNDYNRSWTYTRTVQWPSSRYGYNKVMDFWLTFHMVSNNRISNGNDKPRASFYDVKGDGGNCRFTVYDDSTLDGEEEEIAYGTKWIRYYIFCDRAGVSHQPGVEVEYVENQQTLYNTRASTYNTVYKTVTTATYYGAANHWTTRSSQYNTTYQSWYVDYTYNVSVSGYGTRASNYYVDATRASTYTSRTEAVITGYNTRSSEYNTQSCNINI